MGLVSLFQVEQSPAGSNFQGQVHVDHQRAAQRWTVETDTGVRASAPFLICAVGALSTANMPDIPGIRDFAGECYHTGHWPQEPVSFEGKRVAVVGTGSSAREVRKAWTQLVCSNK